MVVVAPLDICCETSSATAWKLLATAGLASVEVSIKDSKSKTPCGLPTAELKLANGSIIRHTTAILRHLAGLTHSGLLGSSFIQEGQVDSWVEWTALEVDHLVQDGEAPASIFETLEAHLSNRTFLVGQRMTLADISLACSLKASSEKAGVGTLRKQYPNSVRWLLTSLARCEPHFAQASSTSSSSSKTPVSDVKVLAKESQSKPAKATPKTEAAAANVSNEGAENSKKDEKRKAKEEEKKKKEEEKKRKEDEIQAQRDSKFKGPELTLDNFEEHQFGNLFIQSQKKTGREWTSISSLEPSLKDKSVWVRARVHNSRKQGNKLCFLTLRQDVATVQAVIFGQEMAGFAGALPDESVVDLYGKVVCPEIAITSCTQSNVEVNVERIYCIGRSTALPLQLADASRSEAEYEKDSSLVRVGQDIRLDNRVIDLRTVANQAIFRIQSGVCSLFREYLLSNSFQEIHTPKLIGGASEGGADVFRVDYFEGDAFLAQSPQLYKQMALMTDMPRVFEIGPIFRSEKSFTHRHMTEFTGLDIEMTFKDHYHEVLEVLDGLFNHIFKGLTERFAREIEAVRSQYPFEDLKWKYPCRRFKFSEATALLRTKGPALLEQRLQAAPTDYERGVISKHLESVKNHAEDQDISTEDEKVLGVLVHEEFGEDLYIIDKFPTEVRPFYTMPDPVDERWSNAYDVFLRGEEITSGAQRIHDPKMLQTRAEAKGVAASSIQSYIDAFKYGSYPHAGAGIGLERVVMLFLNLSNIRKTSMFPRDPKRLTP